ncbi:ComEC/Rec2 family competence protein [Sneathiella chinensis]|uniref:Competence protein ComEC n=2 Tax=Sneathiella chinensis TaxID=349750 RepID=A0ABQ5U696_9PROT|nr:ComEC/Rec2 family competence protein [Sneathiella chinensis]GLQ07213.1 competence protein ComEC [Sneathiella chinensis]
MASGIGLYFSLDWQPELWWLGLPLPLILLYGLAGRTPLVKGGILALLLVVIGFDAALIRQALVAAPVLQKRLYTDITGTLLEISAGTGGRRLVIAPDRSRDGDASKPLPEKVRVTARQDISHLVPGQTIRATAVLLPPPLPTYPGAYDFQRDFYFKGIGAVGYLTRVPEVLADAGQGDQNHFGLSRLSAAARDRINDYVIRNAAPETAGFAMAIMTGDKGGLSKDDLEAMRRSGLAHLLAISGLHMGMVGGLIFFSLRLLGSLWPRLALNFPIKKAAALCALVGMAGYLFISGMSVSAVRAFIMVGLMFLAICFDRTALSLRNLTMAAILILAIRPESLLGASFQMSFSAVFALIVLYERFGHGIRVRAGIGSPLRGAALYLVGVLFTSLVASGATALFALYNFGQVSGAGVLSNLVAVPLMGLWIMPWTLLSLLALPFGDIPFFLEMAGLGIHAVLETAHFASGVPGAVLSLPLFPTGTLVTLVLGILWFVLWRGTVRWMALCAVPLAALFLLAEKPDILFAESGNLYLVRDRDGGFFVPTLRADRFERERWQIYYGQDRFTKIGTAATDGPFSCDRDGCVFTGFERTIAFPDTWMGIEQDCDRAHLVLSRQPVTGRCRSPALVIDRFDLWRGGTHAVYLQQDGRIRVESVNSVRGNRPWVPERFLDRAKGQPSG